MHEPQRSDYRSYPRRPITRPGSDNKTVAPTKTQSVQKNKLLKTIAESDDNLKPEVPLQPTLPAAILSDQEVESDPIIDLQPMPENDTSENIEIKNSVELKTDDSQNSNPKIVVGTYIPWFKLIALVITLESLILAMISYLQNTPITEQRLPITEIYYSVTNLDIGLHLSGVLLLYVACRKWALERSLVIAMYSFLLMFAIYVFFASPLEAKALKNFLPVLPYTDIVFGRLAIEAPVIVMLSGLIVTFITYATNKLKSRRVPAVLIGLAISALYVGLFLI